MNIGLMVIGDEILSGRRKDRHLEAIINILKKKGLRLSWSIMLSDDFELLVRHFQQSLARQDHVFCTGGIGATPDDLTRQAMAEAAGVSLQHHPEGVSLLKEIYQNQLTEHRLRMVEFPQGADLIPNPVNRIPGFSFSNHYCVPGFPQMAWPMVEWVLEQNRFASHFVACSENYTESAVRITGVPEGDLIPLMELILKQYSGLKVFSLPVMDESERYVDLGVKGGVKEVAAAIEKIIQALQQRACHWRVI